MLILKGEFIGHEDEWVVIQEGVVLKMTPNEKEALAFIEQSPGMFVLYQVNHEEEVAEIDTVECVFEQNAYRVDALVSASGSEITLKFKIDTGAKFTTLTTDALLRLNNLKPKTKKWIALADGIKSERDAYIVSLKLDGLTTNQVLCVTTAKPLLGMNVLLSYRLHMENGKGMSLTSLI